MKIETITTAFYLNNNKITYCPVNLKNNENDLREKALSVLSALITFFRLPLAATNVF